MSNSRPSIDELKAKANVLRCHAIRMTTEAGSGHPTSSLSAAEITTALYFGGFMNYDPKKPDMADRDRFILSKGHAVPILYAAMAEAGFFPIEKLKTFRKIGSVLEGHPNLRRLPGIEASTGSLGQGLSLGVGQALGLRLDKRPSRVFVVIGDGEMGEGQVWEALATAGKYKLGNLTAIVDQNGYQQTGSTHNVLDQTPFQERIAPFGWHTQTIEGNDMAAVVGALEKATAITDQPTMIVCKTRKGAGIIPLMEEAGDLNMHGQPLKPAMAEKAIAMLTP